MAGARRRVLQYGAAAGVVIAILAFPVQFLMRHGRTEEARDRVVVVPRGVESSPARPRVVPPANVIPTAKAVPAGAPIGDDLLEGLVNDENAPFGYDSVGESHRLVRSEPKDPDWSPKAETAMLATISKLPHLSQNSAPRVICSATMCEIAVAVSPAATVDEANYTILKVQSDDILRGHEALGFEPQSGSVALGQTKRDQYSDTLVRYLHRAGR